MALTVFNCSGNPNRDVIIPGRNPAKPFGAIRFQANAGQRQESDVEALRALLAAGRVSIPLTAFEVDRLPELLPGVLSYGGTVALDCQGRDARWRLVEDGPVCRIEVAGHACPVEGCEEPPFETPLALGRHKRNAHRDQDKAE